MAKYRILWFGKGRLSHGRGFVKNVETYDDPKKIPVFDEDVTPVNEGLLKLEEAGKLKVEWVNPREGLDGGGATPAAVTDGSGPTANSSGTGSSVPAASDGGGADGDGSDTNNDGAEPPESDGGEAVSQGESDGGEAVSQGESDGGEAVSQGESDESNGDGSADSSNALPPHLASKKYTLEELKSMKVGEITDICRELGIRGHYSEDKEGKIKLILEHQER